MLRQCDRRAPEMEPSPISSGRSVKFPATRPLPSHSALTRPLDVLPGHASWRYGRAGVGCPTSFVLAYSVPLARSPTYESAVASIPEQLARLLAVDGQSN